MKKTFEIVLTGLVLAGVLATGSRAFATPPASGNLLIWLEGANVSATSGRVTNWNDAAVLGGVQDFTQVTSARRPYATVATLPNGVTTNVVEFRSSGTNYVELGATAAMDTNNTWSWFVVFKPSTLTPSTSQMLLRSGWTNHNPGLYKTGSDAATAQLSGSYYRTNGQASAHARSTGGVIQVVNLAPHAPEMGSRWRISGAVWNGSPSPLNGRGPASVVHRVVDEHRIGSVENTITDAGSDAPKHEQTLIGLNTYYFNFPYDGLIAEVLLYNTALSESDFDAVMDYLDAKYIGVAQPDAWPRRMPIQFTGYPDDREALTNFPALIVLEDGLKGVEFADFKAGGVDLRFTTADKVTLIAHEIESWNAGGKSWVWVRVPVLTNGTTIYAHWGNPSAFAPAYSANGSTWANGFLGVWHLNEASGNRLNFTTNSAFHAVPNNFTGGGGVSGMAGRGVELDGVTNYLEVASTANTTNLYNLGQGAGKQWTVSAWYFARGTNQVLRQLVGKSGVGSSETDYAVFIYKGTNVATGLRWATGGGTDPGSWDFTVAEPPRSNWYHVAATLVASGTSNGTKRIYVNGDAWTATTNYTGKVVAVTNAVRFGYNYMAPPGRFFEGILDEIRIENVARSSNWVWACYQNMADPGAFATMQAIPAGTTFMFR